MTGCLITKKMFATIFRRKETVVALALNTFVEFGMIEMINDAVTIPNWGKHQNIEGIEKRKNYMKDYMQEYRQKQKQISQTNLCDDDNVFKASWKDVKSSFSFECAYCGKKESVVETLQQEHIIPFFNEGKFVLGNIIPACKSCNTSKGKKDLENWYKSKEFFNETRLNNIKEYQKDPIEFLCKRLRKCYVSDIEEDYIENIDNIEKNEKREKPKFTPQFSQHRFLVIVCFPIFQYNSMQ